MRALILGLRAPHFTPGYHMMGFQPAKIWLKHPVQHLDLLLEIRAGHSHQK
jgi:hypothetical protein